MPEDIRNYEANVKVVKKPHPVKVNLNDVPRGDIFIRRWLEEAKMVKKKMRGGLCDVEKGVKKCLYCFNNWGIYYGKKGDICLKCVAEIENKKNQ